MALGLISSYGSATKGLPGPIRQDRLGDSAISTGGLGRKELFSEDGGSNDSARKVVVEESTKILGTNQICFLPQENMS